MLPERVQLARVVARAALAGVGFGWGSRWAGVGVLFGQLVTPLLAVSSRRRSVGGGGLLWNQR